MFITNNASPSIHPYGLVLQMVANLTTLGCEELDEALGVQAQSHEARQRDGGRHSASGGTP
jgi:hypothetical protein